MKIWLDITLDAPKEKECDDCDNGDCYDDCAGDCELLECIPSIAFQNQSFKGVIDPHLKAVLMQLTDSLYIQLYDDEKWLVCSPAGSGRIAVVDQQAIDLLRRFHEPMILSEIITSMPNASSTSIESAVKLFHSLGFLQDVSHPKTYQEQETFKTLSTWMHVTNVCNLRCHYCYLHKSSEHMSNDISLQAVDAIFRSAIRHNYQRVLLKYAGGEASLQLPRVLAIHNYARQLAQQQDINLHGYIMSNGVALSQRVIDQLKAQHISIMISLDGVGRYHDCQRPFINGHGSFVYVDRTITRLLANNLIPHVNVTISQRNLDGLPDLMAYLLEHELPFTLSYYRDNECSTNLTDLQFADEQMINAMYDVFGVIKQKMPKRRLIGSLIDKARMTAAHRNTCAMGQSYLVIDQHGGIAKCHADIKSTVTTINAEDPLKAIREDRQGIQGLEVEKKEGCKSCQWRYWCTGGCPLLTYRITGRSDIKSPNCRIYQALFPEALRLEAMRLLKYKLPFTL